MTDGGAVQDELQRTTAAHEEARSLAARLDAARTYAAEARRRSDDAAARLADEERDVKKLESMSWVRIRVALSGERATALERETAERDAARYAAAEAEHRATMAEADVRAIEAQLSALGDVDGALARALDAKEAWLRERPGSAASRLVDIAVRRGELAALERENREAHAAGRAAHSALREALDVIRSAASWSTWDAFGGGGLLTDMVKYDRLEQAQRLVRSANDALAHLATELADVGITGVQGVDIGELTRTFDIWFDNIFSDMSVRTRIQEARGRLEYALGAVERIGEKLAAAKREIDREAAALDAERLALVRDA
jgi:hypothetical protein